MDFPMTSKAGPQGSVLMAADIGMSSASAETHSSDEAMASPQSRAKKTAGRPGG